MQPSLISPPAHRLWRALSQTGGKLSTELARRAGPTRGGHSHHDTQGSMCPSPSSCVLNVPSVMQLLRRRHSRPGPCRQDSQLCARLQPILVCKVGVDRPLLCHLGFDPPAQGHFKGPLPEFCANTLGVTPLGSHPPAEDHSKRSRPWIEVLHVCRPFGTSTLLAAYDDAGPQLYLIEPSGDCHVCPLHHATRLQHPCMVPDHMDSCGS